MGAVLDALSAYTKRHLARMDRLRRAVCLLDYTLGCMHVIEEGNESAAAAAAVAAVAEESEQHSSESDLTPSGQFEQQQVISGFLLLL